MDARRSARRGALALLLQGRAAFARFGRGDEARIALACGEMAGAILFLFRPTALVGGLALVIVLAWAAGFHFALGESAGRLWLYLTAVLALAAATQTLVVEQRS